MKLLIAQLLLLPLLVQAQVRVDSAEAETALAFMEGRGTFEAVTATRGFQRLQQRETQLSRSLREEDLRRFLTSQPTADRAPALRSTLARWLQADLDALTRQVLAYLPASAKIQATIYPVIKPATNSFVFETRTDPAIFLYLDENVTAEQFANTVAHELHHVGMASIAGDYRAKIAGLPKPARTAADWLGAFSEGIAMLVAAGGPQVHPHAVSPAATRERWDRDMANFEHDRLALEGFLLDAARGKFTDDAAVNKKAMEFFGVQGPWYTVGWRMAEAVERKLGRPALIETMLDPRLLLKRYNEVRSEGSAPWSPELLQAFGL